MTATVGASAVSAVAAAVSTVAATVSTVTTSALTTAVASTGVPGRSTIRALVSAAAVADAVARVPGARVSRATGPADAVAGTRLPSTTTAVSALGQCQSRRKCKHDCQCHNQYRSHLRCSPFAAYAVPLKCRGFYSA